MDLRLNFVYRIAPGKAIWKFGNKFFFHRLHRIYLCIFHFGNKAKRKSMQKTLQKAGVDIIKGILSSSKKIDKIVL